MHTHRVDIFHRADRDHIADRIPHCLKFNFLPSGNGTFNQYLRNRRLFKTGMSNLLQFLRIIRDSPAASAERECRSDNDRIADPFRTGKRFFFGGCDFRGNDRLVNLLHGTPEEITVFRTFNGFNIGPKQTDTVFRKPVVFAQLHRQCKTGLSAKSCQQTVRLFLHNDPLQGFRIERFKVNLIRKMFVGHDRCRVGIGKHDIDSFRFQNTARLRAGIIKLCGLADNDRSRTDHKYLFDGIISGHVYCPPSCG